MKAITTYLRVILAVFLAATCVSKLFGGYQTHYLISQELFAVAIVIEVILTLGLLVERFCYIASVGVAILAGIGIGIEVLGRGTTCGCLGSLVRLTSAQHILLNATAGAVAVIVWSGKSDERRSASVMRAK